MDKEKNDDKIRIWQAFADYIRNNGIITDWYSNHNPIYLALSEQLKRPQNEIRKVLLEMQPTLNLPKKG